MENKLPKLKMSLCPQGASSPATSRAHQEYSAVTGHKGCGPHPCNFTEDKCFRPPCGLAEPHITFFTNLPVV